MYFSVAVSEFMRVVMLAFLWYCVYLCVIVRVCLCFCTFMYVCVCVCVFVSHSVQLVHD